MPLRILSSSDSRSSRAWPRRIAFALALAAAAAVAIFVIYYVMAPGLRVDFASAKSKNRADGRIYVQYWDLWTGFEGEAMQRVVERFNASQDRIWVEKQIISDINQRFLMAVSGNNAPDIASIFQTSVPSFAEKGALLPLDSLAKEHGVGADRYVPIFWQLCHWRGHLYALPTVASTLALHYNKKMFREAGLDPEKPPRSIKELDEMAERLTRRDAKGRLVQLGFAPIEPGWWPQTWAYWFGGDIWDGRESLTLNSEAYIHALEWVQSYSKKYGPAELDSFQNGFGPFASPQNPFLSGLVAMELQGVWMHNFIEKYNPSLEYGIAPFPSSEPDRMATLVESNILVIPSNAPHPREAFEFLAFVQRPENMEQLCLDQRSLPPLAHVSESFWTHHPNTHIRLFYQLAQSKDARGYPQFPTWNEINDEITATFSQITLLRAKPREALNTLQAKMNAQWQEELALIRKREAMASRASQTSPGGGGGDGDDGDGGGSGGNGAN